MIPVCAIAEGWPTDWPSPAPGPLATGATTAELVATGVTVVGIALDAGDDGAGEEAAGDDAAGDDESRDDGWEVGASSDEDVAGIRLIHTDELTGELCFAAACWDGRAGRASACGASSPAGVVAVIAARGVAGRTGRTGLLAGSELDVAGMREIDGDPIELDVAGISEIDGLASELEVAGMREIEGDPIELDVAGISEIDGEPIEREVAGIRVMDEWAELSLAAAGPATARTRATRAVAVVPASARDLTIVRAVLRGPSERIVPPRSPTKAGPPLDCRHPAAGIGRLT